MANNIITAAFSSSTITYTKPAYQYDYGMILQFSGIELPQAYEVHFSNTEFCGESISQIGDESGVTVPDEMFLSGAPIYAWTYLHTGEDDGETVYKTVISINKRAQPSDIEPTPVQQDVITQAIAALNTAVEQTAADVVASGENAQAAAGSATEASGYAEEAKGYAERAESAESEAEGYATRAETAESHAQGYAQTASDKASEANGYATEAKGYSESASSFASDASGYASSAYESAQNASSSASDASSAKDLAVQAKDDAVSAKNSAEGFASDAHGYAESAQESAQDAEESAQSVLGLTADATIDSNVGTPSVEVEVTTESDHKKMSFAFHNLKGVQGEPGISPTITVTQISGGHNVEITDAQGTQDFDVMDGEVSEQDLEDALIDKADVITSSASGELVTIADGGDDLPVVDLSVSLLPVQDLHGQDAPYPPGGGVNLLPPYTGSYTANGLTAVANADGSITVTGTASGTGGYLTAFVNLTKEIPANTQITVGVVNNVPVRIRQFYDDETSDINAGSNRTVRSTTNSITKMRLYAFTTADETYNFTLKPYVSIGNNVDYAPYSNICTISGWTGLEVYQKGFNVWDEEWEVGSYNGTTGEKVTNNTNLRCKNAIPVKPSTSYYCKTPYAMYVFEYDATGAYLGYTTKLNNIIIAQANTRYIRFYLLASYGTTYNHDICINLSGSRNGEYEPYNGATYPIDWTDEAGTIYAGTVDLTTGVLTVTHQFDDMTRYAWNYYVPTSGKNTFNTYIAGLLNGGIGWCDRYKFQNVDYISNQPNGTFYFYKQNASQNRISIRDDRFTDADSFKASVQGMTVVYPLATPLTFQLSETQIATFLGTNNFWSNSNGSLDLEYRADTKLYIEQLTKPSEDDMTANSNIASGKFFMVGNRLMLSTTAIAQGEQIVVGTNCTEVSLADALNQITA